MFATLLVVYLCEIRCYDTRITFFDVVTKDLFGSLELIILHQDNAEYCRTPFADRIDVVKPFSVRELLARVDAVLRRAPERQPVSETLTLGDTTVDFGQSSARFGNGERVELSERERDVLRYLALNRGRPVSREELLQRVWHLDGRQTETRTVDMHVANLRGKLRDDAEAPRMILTVRGKGYQLA